MFVSLGPDCQTRFQISRWLAARDGVGGEEFDCFLNYPPGLTRYPTGPFDWQITPLSAVVRWLERDFRGVYEREDFERPAHLGHYWNRRFRTEHPHDFDPALPFDEAYAKARERFERRVEAFRRQIAEGAIPVFAGNMGWTAFVRLGLALRSTPLMAPRTEGRTKPAGHEWCGDDEPWSLVLNQAAQSYEIEKNNSSPSAQVIGEVGPRADRLESFAR